MKKFFDNPASLSKEILMLSKIGLNEDELEYIIKKKLKEKSEDI